MIYSLTVTNTIGESLTFELSNPWASGYAVKIIDGVGTPDMNVNTTPYGIGDGSVLSSIKAEYRIINLIVWPLAKPTVETARQRLYRYFQIKKKIILTFNTENRIVTIEGYVEKIDPAIFDNPEAVSIEIKCINPYFHKMVNDQTKFYGIEPAFEFIFSVEFDYEHWNEEWKEIEYPFETNSSKIAYGNNEIVILSNERMGEYACYNIGTSKWDIGSFPLTKYNKLITYGDGKFFIASNNDLSVLWSSDLKVWNISEIPGLDWNYSDATIFSISYFEDRLVVLGLTYYWNNSIGHQEIVIFSAFTTDYREWTISTLPTTSQNLSIVYGNGIYLVLPRGGNIWWRSIDCRTWERVESKNYFMFDAPFYANGFFISPGKDPDAIDQVGTYKGRMLYSSDGLDWEIGPNPCEYSIGAVGYIHHQLLLIDVKTKTVTVDTGGIMDFVDIATDAYLYKTSDGINWTKEEIEAEFWKKILYIDDAVWLFSDTKPMYKIEEKTEINDIDLIEFSNYTIDNRMEIDYQGEIDAGIRITIECYTAPGDIIIYNVDTLEYIQIFAKRIEAVSGAPLGPKDIVEINTESGNKYVRLLRNGVYYNILGAMNRNMTWFTLKQGPNTFTYTTSDEHAGVVMSFSYQDTYAGL